MNENLKNLGRTDTVVIDLVDVFWSVLAHWRGVLVFILAFALLLGGYQGYASYRASRDTSAAEKQMTSYEAKLAKYEADKALIDSRAQTLKDEQLLLERYQESSALFRLDPYQVYVSELTYYVEVSAPAAERQSLTANLVRAYAAAILQTDLHQALGLEPEALVEDGFVQVLYDGGANGEGEPENGVFTIRAIGADRAQADAVLTAAAASLSESTPQFGMLVVEHGVTLLSESSSQTADRALITLHNDMITRTVAIRDGLNKCQTDLDKLSAPSKPSQGGYSVKREAVKYGIGGAIAGAVAAFLVYAILFVAKGPVADPDDLAYRYNAAVLGTLPRAKRSGLDRAVGTHLGLGKSREDSLRYIAANIQRVAAQEKRVLLAGSVGTEAVTKLCRELQPLTAGVELIPGGDICADADAVYAFNESGAVICVERLQKSQHAAIRRELETLVRAEKSFLGFVLTEE